MKLNIGGLIVKEGWKILNIQKDEGVDFVGDISDLSRFEDNSIEEIYASHVVEHVPKDKVEITLKGIHRVLKVSGKFYISVPDLDILFHSFRSTLLNIEIKKHILAMIFGGQDDQYDFHYYGYNFEVLEDYLKSSGFKQIEKVESFGLYDDASEFKPYGFPISLNVIAKK
ncbi:methyltransferase domain-containing protein [Candidatus Pelagibacter sp.]|nr:methyltransferase domain-containing protein [Candidatus Pelagibacter sp.]